MADWTCLDCAFCEAETFDEDGREKMALWCDARGGLALQRCENFAGDDDDDDEVPA